MRTWWEIWDDDALPHNSAFPLCSAFFFFRERYRMMDLSDTFNIIPPPHPRPPPNKAPSSNFARPELQVPWSSISHPSRLGKDVDRSFIQSLRLDKSSFMEIRDQTIRRSLRAVSHSRTFHARTMLAPRTHLTDHKRTGEV